MRKYINVTGVIKQIANLPKTGRLISFEGEERWFNPTTETMEFVEKFNIGEEIIFSADEKRNITFMKKSGGNDTVFEKREIKTADKLDMPDKGIDWDKKYCDCLAQTLNAFSLNMEKFESIGLKPTSDDIVRATNTRFIQEMNFLNTLLRNR